MQNLVVLDCEVYPNYTLFAFKALDSKKTLTIELMGADIRLSEAQHKQLNSVMRTKQTFGYNSRNYDMPIILYALKGKTAKEIHALSDHIIENNLHGWMTMKRFDLIWDKEQIKHFDIQEPSPGVKISLKLYGARLNSQRLKDLPIEPGTILTPKEMGEIKTYCINDLDTTIDLFEAVKDRMQLRFDMAKIYGDEVLSKSDAQIAETVIKKEINKLHPDLYLKAPELPEGKTFRYTAPEFISFKTEQLQKILETLQETHFALDAKGSIALPKELKQAKIKIGDAVYQLGIGGIHSTEKKQIVIPKYNEVLIDKDVASYYPSIILNCNLYPKHLGSSFLKVYEKIVNDRLKAKKEGNKVVNESLKIVINGSFGKLGSKYSVLYSPDLMIAVTLTGQLALLMLIEELELNDIKVVSANTDGFVSLMKDHQANKFDDICFGWELTTGFELEDKFYNALFSRDVNNYLAVTNDGKNKGKGIFTFDNIGKNPSANICIEAVIEFLTKNKNIADTINNCRDLTKFLHVRSVTGGAVYKGEYLGRVVRWIYAKDGTTINYKKNGNKVAKSDGSKPIMDLDIDFPIHEIDFSRYIAESREILEELGYENKLE